MPRREWQGYAGITIRGVVAVANGALIPRSTLVAQRAHARRGSARPPWAAHAMTTAEQHRPIPRGKGITRQGRAATPRVHRNRRCRDPASQA
jgi:hypothetical protein